MPCGWTKTRRRPTSSISIGANTADADVEKCLKLLTFLPLDEIAALTQYKDERINHAKEVLAYELTKMVHGEEKANAAQSEARGAFGGEGEMPEKTVPRRDADHFAGAHRDGAVQVQRRSAPIG